MNRNKSMRVCLKIAAMGALLVSAASVAPARQARSVVRADARTGRLVRTVIVPARPAAAPSSGPAQLDPAIGALVEEAARKHEVDPLLVHSVIQVESAYNPYATSHKGAQGLMQLVPDTAKRFGVRNSYDARENIDGGVRYLKYLNTLFDEDLRLTLAAYNAGEGAVMKYGNSIPPYRETEQYVQKVGRRYAKARATGTKQTASAAPSGPAMAVPKEQYSPVEYFVDPEGRVHMRTRPAAGTLTP